MNDLELARIYRRAADYVRTYGWDKGPAWGFDGERRCAEGAILSAVNSEVSSGEPVGPNAAKARAAINFAAARVQWEDLFTWNDADERTQDDVIQLFETLADELELRYQIAHQSTTKPARTTQVERVLHETK